MEFPGDIVANIIEQRLNLTSSNKNSSSPSTTTAAPASASDDADDESKKQTLQQINHILSFGLPVNIYIILTNEKCQIPSNECKTLLAFECWNIQRLKETEIKVSVLSGFTRYKN